MDGQPEREPPSAGSDQAISGVFSTKLGKRSTSRVEWAALIDRGANSCIAGNDMRVIAKSEKTIDISGIDDHTVRNLTLVTAGAVVRNQIGDIIMILHQAADMTRESKTILSAGQLEDFGCIIKDKSPKVPKGQQGNPTYRHGRGIQDTDCDQERPTLHTDAAIHG